MSVIVAVKSVPTMSVWLGSDSYGGNIEAWTINERSDPKIFTRKLRLVGQPGEGFTVGFGCTSSYRMIQLLQYELQLPDFNRNIHEPMEWMVTKLIPAIRELFKNYGYATIDKNVESGGNFLVTFNGHLFEVTGDFQVIDYANQEYAAVGCGEQFALGSLFSSTEQMNSERCIEAIEAAIKYSAYCNGEVNLIEVK